MVLLDNGGRASGECTLLAPPVDLAPLIEHLWIQERAHATSTWRVVADAAPHLIATMTKTDRGPRAAVMLVGARSTAADIDVSRRLLTVGVRLKPGTLPALVNFAARELTDRSLPAASVFSGTLLHDVQISADAPAHLIACELSDLVRRAAHGHTANCALPEAAAGSARVAEVAARLRSPSRTLREIAMRDVGLGPKRMLRIYRLHAALAAARSRRTTWAHIALGSGFADQAHLIREMRALLGETPSAWSSRGSRHSSQAT
jgi:AraC-like DNA-binding protein